MRVRSWTPTAVIMAAAAAGWIAGQGAPVQAQPAATRGPIGVIRAGRLALVKQLGTYLDFDIYNDGYIMSEGPKVGIEPASLAKEHLVGQIQRDNCRKAVQAGEKMAFATNAGVCPTATMPSSSTTWSPTA